MSQTRQLAAIMFTDIVGYTALMGKNELKAFEILKRNRQIQKQIIEQYNGRWIKELGDGVLASFNTASDAVGAAINIQQVCASKEEFQLRIGVDVGEVVFENNDVFGDGVNTASRIQSIASPGAIWISEAVYHNVANKMNIEAIFIKTETLKNVKDPVTIFQVKAEGVAAPLPVVNTYSKRFFFRTKKIKSFLLFLGFATMIFAGYFIYKHVKKHKKVLISQTPTELVDKSIAVLPFANLSNDENQEYFSDGLSEELLNLLVKIPELKVIGRTSSFSFKGRNEDLRSIAQKLGVAYLLDGSVRRDGNIIRISAQLIKAFDGSHLWGETYNRELEGVFKVQDEIAAAVVKHLKLSLLAVSTSTSAPSNSEAHTLLLEGNYFLEKRDKENVDKALGFYFRALATDSLNAKAWAAVAKCYIIQASWGWIDRSGFQQAYKAASRAIELDNTQAEAYRTFGEAKMYEFDWEGAAVEYNKALNLEPRNPDMLRSMGVMATTFGRLDEAIRWDRQSLTLDPIKPITYLHLGINQYYSNRLVEAITSFKKALELNPQFPRPHVFLGKVYLKQGNPEMALAEMEQETDPTWKEFGISLANQGLGRQKEADKALKNYIARFQKTNMLEIAELYAFRGEKDKAFEWIDKAYKGRAAKFIWFKNDPLLENLESDSRYTNLLKKLNLPLN